MKNEKMSSFDYLSSSNQRYHSVYDNRNLAENELERDL